MKESEKMDKYQEITKESKKPWNIKVTVIPIVVGGLVAVAKRLVKRLQDLEISGREEIDQDTEKSPGDLRRLVTQISVKDHQR